MQRKERISIIIEIIEVGTRFQSTKKYSTHSSSVLNFHRLNSLITTLKEYQLLKARPTFEKEKKDAQRNRNQC